MGFYSFYKIIKDMVRTIFGNRVFRILLIACVCGFLLCLISEKVQASYVGDTNGYFDDIQVLQYNTNTFNLSSKDNNSNIQIKIKANTWNFSNVIILVENNNSWVDIFKTSGDFKYDFTNNKFCSTEYMYYMQVRVSNGVADFTSATNNGIAANSLQSWGAWSSSYKIGLYGNIYDYSNNEIVASSTTPPEPVDFFENATDISLYSNEIFLGSSNYGGVCSLKIPDFVQDYDNILVTLLVNEHSITTKTGAIIFTNNKIFVDSSGVIKGESNGDYYFSTFSFYNINVDYSNYTLSNFTYSTSPSIYGILGSNNNYSYKAVKGTIYSYENQNEILYQYIPFRYPFFEPSDSEIQSLNWDNIFVELGDFDINDNPLYIHRLEVSRTIVGTGAQDPISYYYNNMSIKLTKGGKYWRQLLDTDKYYFSIPMSQFNFKPEKAYFLVLTDNPKGITSSIGKVNEEYYNTIFQIVEINSGNLITMEDVINNNIEKMGDDVTFLGRTIEESLAIGSENNQNLTAETNDVIDTNINFNNNNSGLDNVRNGFFSRLTSILTNVFDYDISQVDTITFPILDKNVVIRSDMISAYIPSTLSNIIQAMWFFIFNFYLFRFINDIYHSFKTGKILNGFTSSNEVITNDML